MCSSGLTLLATFVSDCFGREGEVALVLFVVVVVVAFSLRGLL